MDTKIVASPGNRTRVARMGILHDTTTPATPSSIPKQQLTTAQSLYVHTKKTSNQSWPEYIVMLSEFMWLLSAGWESVLYSQSVRMAERSKALRSGRSPLLWAWVRIPLLTNNFVQFVS